MLRLAQQTFSDNEVQKAEFAVQLKRLRQKQETLAWPAAKGDLPVITWEDCELFLCHKYILTNRLTSYDVFLDQRQAESRGLICVAGHIHDVGDFINEHPGGPLLLKKNIGKDATTAFFGGIYGHSNAAHNVRFPSNLVAFC